MSEGNTLAAIPVARPPAEGAVLQRQLRVFLRPLLGRLAHQLDVRLVRTLRDSVERDSVEAVLRSRDRPQAIWLTELGAVLLGAQHTPAGVKRLSRLLRAAWSSDEIEQWLLEQADEEIARHPVGEALVLLDESVAEKPESLRAEGLCRVRSGKARRLARPRRGFGGGPPPPRPVTVPGIHWLAAIVTGLTSASSASSASSGAPLLACCRWWSPTAPGDPATTPVGHEQTATTTQLLLDLVRRWGAQVLFVADRGFARRALLDVLLDRHARFVIRWPKRYRLVLRTTPTPTPALPARPATNAWRLTAGRKPWGHETIWDAKRRAWLTVAFFAVPVWLPDGPGAAQQLWLVVSRGRRGTEPWRLLTSEPIQSTEDARRIVRAYARRWQIEVAFRFSKSDLGAESVRVHQWDHRCKLLALLTLAYAFLIHLLATQPDVVRLLVRLGCHRSGRHAAAVALPLYRLHAAVASLLATALPPPIARSFQT